MPVIKKVEYSNNNEVYMTHYAYFCIGCNKLHFFGVNAEGHHSWNNDYDKPTISPSLLQNFRADSICHSFIRNGTIEYLGDCFHSLKNQIIPLPDTSTWNEQALKESESRNFDN